MQPNDPMIAANQVARELNQPEGGKGAKRLAADLALADATRTALAEDISEQEAWEALSRIPGFKYGSAMVNHSGSTYSNSRAYIAYAQVGEVRRSFSKSSNVSLSNAVTLLVADVGENAKRLEREATIRARIEREMAEAEAAEKALSSTAPLEFRPDGSGADCLPLDPFDGGCPADTRGGGE